jgi:hypothetical protein
MISWTFSLIFLLCSKSGLIHASSALAFFLRRWWSCSARLNGPFSPSLSISSQRRLFCADAADASIPTGRSISVVSNSMSSSSCRWAVSASACQTFREQYDCYLPITLVDGFAAQMTLLSCMFGSKRVMYEFVTASVSQRHPLLLISTVCECIL